VIRSGLRRARGATWVGLTGRYVKFYHDLFSLTRKKGEPADTFTAPPVNVKINLPAAARECVWLTLAEAGRIM
jgi:hypothetical protein